MIEDPDQRHREPNLFKSRHKTEQLSITNKFLPTYVHKKSNKSLKTITILETLLRTERMNIIKMRM